jgi:LPS export ABC transporter protein LptC
MGVRLQPDWRLAAALTLIFLGQGAAGAEPDAVLRVTGMTFVGRQGADAELVLHSERAFFHPDTDTAELESVDAVFNDDENGDRFTLQCDRAELDVASNDFVASGNVRGVTVDGQRYATPAVRYDHDKGLLHSDERVVLEDESGTFQGDGFRYLVRENRFQLLGNVRMVQP